METNIVSVERVQQYIDLEPEAPLEIPEKKPPAAWPERGSVHFEDLSLRYREGLDLVLKVRRFRQRAAQARLTPPPFSPHIGHHRRYQGRGQSRRVWSDWGWEEFFDNGKSIFQNSPHPRP